MSLRAVEWTGGPRGCARLLDQTLLPGDVRTIDVRSVPQMVDAIARLAVRGAPAIGVAAAYGVVLGVQPAAGGTPAAALEAARVAALALGGTRPTAVNLFGMLERMLALAQDESGSCASGEALLARLLAEADAIAAEVESECRRMGEHGAGLLREGMRVLTHCNAGALATVGIGTALAPLYVATERGLRVQVFADETRPLLQGARLTAWELARAGIEVTLIADSAAASLMRAGRIDLVFVGADRIARNGDVCNKIGTYGVAVLAAEHGVPFYAVAPLSTFDPRAESGADIPIEEREGDELTRAFGAALPARVRVYNPAFDVTPAARIRGLVTEHGILERPTRASVEDLLRTHGRL